MAGEREVEGRKRAIEDRSRYYATTGGKYGQVGARRATVMFFFCFGGDRTRSPQLTQVVGSYILVDSFDYNTEGERQWQ